MALELDHTIVAARDKESSAELLATILDVPWSNHGVGPFCPVFINQGLTWDFDQVQGEIVIQHFCFRMDDQKFDSVVAKLDAMGMSYRSTPQGPMP